MQVILKYPGLHSCFSSRIFCSIIVLISKQVLGNGDFFLCKHRMLPRGTPVVHFQRWILQDLMYYCSDFWHHAQHYEMNCQKKKKVTYLKLYFFAGSLNACFTKSAALSGLSHSNWENCSAIPFILAPNSCFNYGKIYLLLVRMLQRLCASKKLPKYFFPYCK